MKVIHVLLIPVILFSGCIRLAEPRKKDMLSKQVYEYSVVNDKLVSQKETSYTYQNGLITDSTILHTAYFYHKNGLKYKEAVKKSVYDYPVLRLFTYNDNDSLVYFLELNNAGDTARWIHYGYFPDGRKVLAEKALPHRIKLASGGQGPTGDMEFRKYKYRYVGAFCVGIQQFNSSGDLVQTTEIEHQGALPIIERVYHYTDTGSVMSWEKNFDYSKSTELYNYYVLNNVGDTIAYHKKTLAYDELTKVEEQRIGGTIHKTTYYSNGKIAKVSASTPGYDSTTVTLFEYDEKGRIAERIQYLSKGD